ncbi:ABC transporter substrate-binding protein [Acetobacteraceae bacterium]|nr:ABC transporter substrate-binding protein [Acetobacteraceae bacterium]
MKIIRFSENSLDESLDQLNLSKPIQHKSFSKVPSLMSLSRFLRSLPLSAALATGSFLTVVNAPHAQAQDAAQSGRAFVTDFGAQIATIINAPITLTEKRREILPLISKNVDIPAIGQYCLGHYWKQATEEEQKEYLELFRKVLMHAITTQVENFQNISINVLSSTTLPLGEKVDALVTRPSGEPIKLSVVTNGEPPKIVDVYTEGMSIRITQRNDYRAFLGNHNGEVKQLILAMRKQVGGYDTTNKSGTTS